VGLGVRRAPLVTTWGWNAEIVAKTQIPILMVSGEHDKQVSPERVRELYADLPLHQKIFIDLACSSHKRHVGENHLLLFRASFEWLTEAQSTESRKECCAWDTRAPKNPTDCLAVESRVLSGFDAGSGLH